MMEDALEDEEVCEYSLIQDYDFEYEDEEDEDADVVMENKYYNAKEIKGAHPQKAISEFQDIINEDVSKTEWGFKSLKQQTKIYFVSDQPEQALETYKRMFEYMKSFISQNYAEKSINSILDYATASSAVSPDHLQSFYDAPRELAPTSLYNGMKIKLKLKLARNYDAGNTYEAALGIENAIPHPCTIAIIREYGGKMHMSESTIILFTTGNWPAAQIDFFQAFNNYDEAGSSQRVVILKYLVLTHILMGSGINPFDSQETKPYKDDAEMAPLVALLDACESHDIQKAESILKKYRGTLVQDDLIRVHLADVLHELRVQFIQEYVKSYRTVRFDRLAQVRTSV
ncbi:hypothetical protein MNAN1_002299 [Malassezia nana]|uniref:PCI domain-containing protein n=1 Tax=Malassezia nana TaxID=180528 RepID=A0AAF0EMU5_9BASI|nr:hypothetical protein MNAN1_002299 [Malassezia nana]